MQVDVLEDDAIFDLRPEGVSHPAISVVAEESLSLSDMHRVTSSVYHIRPWALAQTSIFSKNNTEIKYKLNCSKAMMGIFCFQCIKARIMLEVLN